MLRTVTGTLQTVEEGTAVLTPTGFPIEIEILAPAYWTPNLCTKAGDTVTVFCRLHLESQNQGASFVPRLLGFPSATDRAFFEVFTSVKGLGQKRAMRAMASPPAEIATWIASRNTKALQSLPEIGKRLAETVVAELHGKVERFAAATATIEPTPIPQSGPAEDAVAALIALGQTRADAELRVSRVLTANPGELSADEIVARSFAAT